MTYDLTLRPKTFALDEDAFVEYFNDRPNWELPEDAPDVAAYFNQATGVYFHLRYRSPDEDEENGSLTFVLNFFRCRPFALEADRELVDLVAGLNLAVEDPQQDGIAGNTYDSDAFLRGWTLGNRLGHRSAIADGAPAPTYDGATIERIWRWNYDRAKLEADNGGYYLAPFIGYVEAENRVQTIFVYEVGQNMLVPRTDLVDLMKGDLSVVVPWPALEEALALAASGMIDEPVDYWAILDVQAERKLAKFFKRGHPTIAVTAMRLMDVHAREDVEAT